MAKKKQDDQKYMSITSLETVPLVAFTETDTEISGTKKFDGKDWVPAAQIEQCLNMAKRYEIMDSIGTYIDSQEKLRQIIAQKIKERLQAEEKNKQAS